MGESLGSYTDTYMVTLEDCGFEAVQQMNNSTSVIRFYRAQNIQYLALYVDRTPLFQTLKGQGIYPRYFELFFLLLESVIDIVGF